MNLIAIFTKKLLKKKTIYSIWELYPEIAQKLNELNSNFLLNTFKKVDNFCLRVIDEVVVNSDEMKQYLIDSRKIESKKMAAITFGGWANDKKINLYKSKLISLLKSEGISFSDNFFFFGYNAPYEFFNRKNEVLVELPK